MKCVHQKETEKDCNHRRGNGCFLKLQQIIKHPNILLWWQPRVNSDISNVRAVKQIQLAPKPIHKSRKMMHITTAGFPISLLVCNQSTYITHDMYTSSINWRVCKRTGEEEKCFQFCWSVETGGHIPDKFHHHQEEIGHTPNIGTTECECVSVLMQLHPFAKRSCNLKSVEVQE